MKEIVKEVFMDVVGTGWLLFLFFTILDVFNGFRITARIFFRLRDLFWTFRHRGDPITVYFYAASMLQEPFRAHVHHCAGGEMVFATNIPGLGVYGRLSVAFTDYGTAWCWGHEGEEVEALAVSRALA